METQKKCENINTDEETLNLIGDCIETVYKCIDKTNTHLPIDNLNHLIKNKTNPHDFEILKTIAKGGYGEVFLVKKDQIYAMKRVAKDVILRQPNTALFMAEKSLLVDSINSKWLVSAKMTLQDDDFLYYFMDFIPGGDFMGLLSKEDVLEEDWVRFYVIELVAALDELHKLGWIHRDLKPDNILIGKDGHIKLADFGSSIKMENGIARSSYVVGTPDYVSPDILESGQLENDYNENIDFWTLGVIIYEMLFGATPFYSATLVETYKKITSVSFTYPFKISEDIKDLISKLICKKEERLGIKEIKSHKFFQGVDWNNVKEMIPPFIPEISSELDTSNFMDTSFEMENQKSEKINYIDFVGFSYDPKMVSHLRKVIKIDDSTNVSQDLEGTFNKMNINNIQDEKDIIKEDYRDTKVLNNNDEKDTIRNNKNESTQNTNNKNETSMNTCKNDDDKKDLIKKTDELQNIEKQINEAQGKLKEKTEEYKNLLKNLINEKEEFSSLENELQEKRREIENINKIIEERKSISEDYLKITNNKNIKINFLDYDSEKLNEINSKFLLCYNQTQLLEENFRNIKYFLNKNKQVNTDNLKKQVRMLTSEVKEYQQKFNQEIQMRKQLEEELKSIKSSKNKETPVSYNSEFICNLFVDKQKLRSVIRILEDMFYINDLSCHIGNVYIKELKNNEMYHESYKNRSLILKIIFISESVKSISSSSRRSIKSLEGDYKIEMSMKSGLENMMPLLQGRQLEEARLQYEGTLKKISQLEREMETARKCTLPQEDEEEDPVKLYEFNNHLFSSKTFPPGTLCEHCNEVLYGVSDQGLECKDCKMVVHNACYILGDVSCELYSAFKRGKSFYILMRSIEEKEKLLSVYKRF
ncbi:Rho-associated protein kinase [Vairimorpha necatrix]|uniref:non-specific serine/threonine protein kinase n=1 Tax=Vairimorpha necatrix TaxID=6039 RepID=A0AAX4J9S8_9MICR